MSTNTGRTYNLRQRKKVTGQVQDAQKTRKSRIPVPKKTVKGQTGLTESANSKPNQRTKARVIPDFKKLHQDWNDKFNKGKAVNKKTCTKVQAFDLTTPGTKPNGKFDREDVGLDEHEEDLKADDSALQSILDGAGLERCKTPSCKGSVGKKTKAISPSSILRPRQHQVQEIKTDVWSETKPSVIKGMKSDKENKQDSKPGKQRLSMKDIQKEFDIEFQTDASALTSILNNTGVSHARHNVIGRQTTAGIATANYSGLRSNKAHLRTSIYDRPVRMSIYDRRWTKATLRSQLHFKPACTTPSPLKPVLATPARVLLLKNQNEKMARTPGTASRVIKPVVHTVESSCNSPALRTEVNKPTPQRVARQCSVRKVRWAEVLRSPENENSMTDGNGPDKVVTTLKFTDVDDEQTSLTVVKPTKDTATETYLQKVIELEEQLLQEILKLQVETKPVQKTAACDSSAQPTNQETALKLMPVDADCALDLTTKSGNDDSKVLHNSHNVNDNLPVDLTVKTPSRQGNESQPLKDQVFKSPFPRDGLHPAIRLDSRTPFSVKTARMVPAIDHNDTPALQPVSSRLRSATGSEVQASSVTNSLDPFKFTSCVTHTPGSVKRTIEWESKNPRTLGLPTPLTSKLYNVTDTELERHQTRDLTTSKGRMTSQMHQLPASSNVMCSQPITPASSLQHKAIHRHFEQSIPEHDVHRALKFASPHNSTLSNYHNDALDSRKQDVEDIRWKGATVPMPLKSVSDTVQYQTLGFATATVNRLGGLEVITPRPIDAGWHVFHDVASSAQSTRGTEGSKTISSTPQVADKLSLTRPMSAWGEPGQVQTEKQYYNVFSTQPCETSLLNVITPLAVHRSRLLGQSSVISPVPRYVHKPSSTGLNDDVPSLTDGRNQSSLGSGRGRNEVCEASDVSRKTGIRLTHVQKLDHVTRMALKTGGKYKEVMLDEEVALFACRLTNKFSPKPKVPHDFTNPVASTLLHGDEMHFIPINEAHELKALPVPGSAFMALKHS